MLATSHSAAVATRITYGYKICEEHSMTPGVRTYGMSGDKCLLIVFVCDGAGTHRGTR